jgi:hypothetical protein
LLRLAADQAENADITTLVALLDHTRLALACFADKNFQAPLQTIGTKFLTAIDGIAQEVIDSKKPWDKSIETSSIVRNTILLQLDDKSIFELSSKFQKLFRGHQAPTDNLTRLIDQLNSLSIPKESLGREKSKKIINLMNKLMGQFMAVYLELLPITPSKKSAPSLSKAPTANPPVTHCKAILFQDAMRGGPSPSDPKYTPPTTKVIGKISSNAPRINWPKN